MPQFRARVRKDRVVRSMRDVVRRQVPFAVSRSINDAVFRGRRFSLSYWVRIFPKRKNPRFPSAVLRVRKASKRRLRGVLFDSRGLKLINLQVTGGIRVPETSSRLAIPTSNVTFTKAGRVRRSNFRKLFRIKNTLYRRTAKGRGGQLQPMFHLANSARIKPAFVLRPILVRMRRYFFLRVGPNLRNAIRTAR